MKEIFEFNHIDRCLSELDVKTLKDFYRHYHKKYWCFKPMNTCSPNPEKSYTYNYQKHEPSGFCFYIKGIVPGITFEPIIYTKTKSTDDISKYLFLN